MSLESIQTVWLFSRLICVCNAHQAALYPSSSSQAPPSQINFSSLSWGSNLIQVGHVANPSSFGWMVDGVCDGFGDIFRLVGNQTIWWATDGRWELDIPPTRDLAMFSLMILWCQWWDINCGILNIDNPSDSGLYKESCGQKRQLTCALSLQ